MDRVEITRYMIGICGMAVCAINNATDEEILHECNQQNPSGTSNGWTVVVRNKLQVEAQGCQPVACEEHEGRTHFLILC